VAHRDIVVIGASAGGVEALKQIVSDLPANLPAAVFVTLHFPEHRTSVLPRILARESRLPVAHAVDREPIVSGRLYVAPPDSHLLLARRGIRLAEGPKENGNRPAIDPMFRSAALSFGPRVIGVVLTGNLDDGTSGLRAIKRARGVAVAQEPREAAFPSMPLSAIEYADVDHVVPLQNIAQTIVTLSSDQISDVESSFLADDQAENAFAAADARVISDSEHHRGHLSS
jgi:two-component system, chemotaxis family, protein-glutamate methylesterase/glutaminase